MQNKMKRFYKNVTVEKITNTHNGKTGYEVRLDNRPIKTPLKNTLRVESKELAEIVAGEWRRQEEYIMLDKMFISRMTFGALDIDEEEKGNLRQNIKSYSQNDTLCYRESNSEHAELIERQREHWDKWLEWAKEEMNISLNITEGIMPIEQPRHTIETISERVDALNDFELIAMGVLVRAMGSYVLAEAVRLGVLTSAEACAIAFLEQNYQSEKWGIDEEALERQKYTSHEISNAAKFIRAL